MSSANETVKLEERSVVGKGLNQLRRDGMVPGVIHNHGQESIHIMVAEADLAKVYKQAGKHHPLQLQVGTAKHLALIKDVHYNPVKRSIEHVVFQAIRQNEKVEAEIPLHLEGEIPAEKVGLMVLRQLDSVEIEAFPRDLPDQFTVDATRLVELHDKLTVADIVAPEGVTILTDADHPIATVVETKAQISEEAEAETVEGEEGEVAEGEEGDKLEADAEQTPEGK
jgi:large subunit ribosomal protein L25